MTSPRVVTSGPPELPGIQRGVGLDDVVHQASAPRAKRAPERADDAARHRIFEAVRIADRDRDLADLHSVRIAERDERQMPAVLRHAQQGQVGVRIVADDVRAMLWPSEPVTRSSPRRATTWLLVTTKPSGVSTKPEPEPAAGSSCPPRGRPDALADAVDSDDRGADQLDGVNDRLRIRVDERAVVEERWKAHESIVRTRSRNVRHPNGRV